MADVAKRFAKGYLSSPTSSMTSVYKVPVNKHAIVKAMTLCAIADYAGQAPKVTIRFGGTYVLFEYIVKANDTITIPFMDQILEQNEEIDIKISSTGTGGVLIHYYISGREVDV